MARLVVIFSGLFIVGAIAHADGPPALVPADFRLYIKSFGVAKEPIYTEDVVYHSGRIYVFPSNVKEVTIIEPAKARLDLIDTGRRVQCEFEFSKLDNSMTRLKSSLREAAEKLEKQGGKAKLIEARMTRDLFETKLETTFDPKTRRLRMKNPVVEVDAESEPEVDAGRLALINSSLVNIARLAAYRVPEDLPPFIEFEAIAALTVERKLRPTSMTYVYRLAGPPQKMRRTYEMIDKLTDRELEALKLIDRLSEVAPSLRYDQFRVDR